MKTLLANLATGFRLATFGVINVNSISTRTFQIVLAYSVSTLLPLLIFSYLPFSEIALVGAVVACALLYIQFIGYIILKLTRDSVNCRRFLMMVNLAAPTVYAVLILLRFAGTSSATGGSILDYVFIWLTSPLVTIWPFAIVIYIFYVIYRDEFNSQSFILRTSLFTAAFLGLFALLVGNSAWEVFYEPSWDESEDYDDEDSDYEFPNEEDVYASQPILLGAEFEKIPAEKAGVADLYSVVFGGDSDDDVFMTEAQFVSEVIEKNMDGKDKVVTLINSLETYKHTPLASVTNLRAAVNHFSKVMNKEEDVLLLYFTSHGAISGTIDINMSYLNLNELDAEGLRTLLDDAKIKWRVIIISACYAGSFIEDLRDEHTLIITASDGKSTSFGCSDEFELTYFAEALFKNQLAKNVGLIEAFNNAAAEIRLREADENLQNSNPQIDYSPVMLEKLQQMQLGKTRKK